ncbi:transcription termination/antitermination NusG family protein, partial [Streptomyces albogriseolus]|uniref:transcription termination/antitermination NusG family protein n=1 Tax=Streptomyces albogriseolus TaxID=1887 RepID=UPI0036FFFB1A
MSDPNVNDAVEPYGEGAESAEDALAAVEDADVEDTEASAEAEAADTTEAEAAEDESAEAAEEAEAEPEDDRDPVEKLREELRSLPGEWYVIHTYAGYENRVKTNLEQRAVSLNVEDYIFQAEVPQEEVVQIKNGDRKTIKQNKL